MIGFKPTINPGRHRRQKAKVHHYLQKGREERLAELLSQQRYEDRRRHEYAERVRLIRQIKHYLGFPLLQYEDYEYVSKVCFSKQYNPEKLKYAIGYFDPSVTAEDFDKLMANFPAYYAIESWLNKRHTMLLCFEFKGEWHKREIKSTDVFPDFVDPYWFDPKFVNMTDENWRHWKMRGAKEILAAHEEKVAEKNTPEGDALNPPEIIWNGNSSEHFYPYPRKRLWRRFIAALTNQKP